ncbi:hypothetical protein GTY65_31025 [Streptomyces sp. SID8379]|uniref:hypothetical protein n=1 Tax=unclassified Streptomyces TaxID=2593676 RepID=UPI000377CCC3|nr:MULTISPECIES: hypothetical protein [unclassified Streptomyces]MYW68476.1 hypothetical protein [Streptomyces sp. SID8379]
MADEHYRWLDRDAAERLLRGEPLEAVSDDAARQALELVAALDALTALSAGPEGELPGEDVALKAFREARAVSAVDGAVTSIGATGSTGRSGRHRVGPPAEPDRRGPRWGRPVRFGLAAAVAACMVGGVAAAGSGVLPSPFGGRDDPAPASSVSAVASPDRPLAPPSPSTTAGGDEALPDGSASPDDGTGSTTPDRSGSAGNKGSPSAPDSKATGNDRGSVLLRREIAEACAKYRGGRLSADEKQRLRDSVEASGRSASDIARFCDRVLGRSDGSDGPREFGDSDGSGDFGDGDGRGGTQDGDSDGDSDGDGRTGGASGNDTNGFGNGNGDTVGFHTRTPGVSPSRTYSASPELPTAGPSPSATASASASPSAPTSAY